MLSLFGDLSISHSASSSLRVLAFRGMDSGPITRAEQAWCSWWPLSLLAYFSQKPRIWGLEGWLSESVHFPGTRVGGSQPPVAPAPGI